MMSDRPIHPPNEDLFAYRDGELSPEKRAIIEAHVIGCSTCRSFIDQVSSLEAELRQSPDRAPAEYLEHLHEAVRARVAAAGPVLVAGAEETLGEAEAQPALGRDRRAAIRGSRERRVDGADGSRDSGRIKEAPKLPWAAILSTASAAAAVLVVVVILMRQGFRPELSVTERARERPAGQAPALGTKPDRDLRAAKDARKKSADAVPKPEPEAVALGKVAEDHTRGGRPDEAITQKEEMNESSPSPENARDQAKAAPQALSAPDASAPPSVSDQLQAPSPYDALMQRLGIPLVWDGAVVTPEALEQIGKSVV